ncbi:MAG: biosynthetic arginine decarboxylase [Thiogranum sp.]
MNWSIDSSRERYNLPGWSDGYFDINRQGHLTVRLAAADETVEVDLFELAGELRRSGLNWPVLVRCNNILRQRLDCLLGAFDRSRDRYAYGGSYRAAYPVKVNQQFSVVNTILEHGAERVGLEAGSKSELMAVLGLSKPEGLVICNGYKDREYIRLALIGRKLGQPLYLVIEKLSELEQVIRQARELDVRPLLGVRVRLASIGAGNWQNSGGTRSKFGLHAAQVLQLVARLRAEDMLDGLQLLHFHLGSQLAGLRDIRRGLHEAARFYAELHALGAPLSVVDVGGGLGVDYEGTASRSFCSMDYSLEAYAELVVSVLHDMCVENGLPHPDIVTESGRAMTAHHAILITNVIDTEQSAGEHEPQALPDVVPDSVRALEQIYRRLTPGAAQETLATVSRAFEDVQQAYCQGYVSLAQRALAEQYYFAILGRIADMLDTRHRERHSLGEELDRKLTDKVFCNLSVFQSLPDVWAIDQLFPIVPLQRLDEAPDRRAVIEDLTCDSDGRIDYYVAGDGVADSLSLHAVKPGELYLLGFFMVGAYQEILGDMHNLFGDTDAVNLEVCADGSFSLGQAEHGDRVDELLGYVHFDPDRLRAAYRRRVQEAGLPAAEASRFLAELESGLTGYTYHED